ncbi:mucin-5AC-like isoform X1 [Dermacentor silvarum]|uniref:mucin-5AC-like isoform X1 n=1 Tax=Dermacentor silvarum TaxID=543639 RepID=UPI002100EFE4|nr:mucin-5AC-like isoform X1 [Dermacentor silvarum]
MSWAQISASMQAKSSEDDVAARRARQNREKKPIIMISSPHPTVITGDFDPSSPVQMGASMMSPLPGSPVQGTPSATMFISGTAASPTSIPVQQTSSGNLILAAEVQMTSPSTTLLQSIPAGSKICGSTSGRSSKSRSKGKSHRISMRRSSSRKRIGSPTPRSPSGASNRGSGFAMLHAEMQSDDSGSRSSGSFTALAFLDVDEAQKRAKKKATRPGSKNKLKRRSSKPDDALTKAFVEALSITRSPAATPSTGSLAGSSSMSSGSTTGLDKLLSSAASKRPSKKQVRRQARRRSGARTPKRRGSNTDGALAQALMATLSGGMSSPGGGPGGSPSMSALITTTSAGAVSQRNPAQQETGQMNFVLNLPNRPEPAVNTLTLTIVQDPNTAAQAGRRR